MHWFHQLGKINGAYHLCDQQRHQEWLSPVSGSQFILLRQEFKTQLFHLHRKGIPLKLCVRRKRWAINIPQFLTAFPFVYAFQSILNQRDNKANLFQAFNLPLQWWVPCLMFTVHSLKIMDDLGPLFLYIFFQHFQQFHWSYFL